MFCNRHGYACDIHLLETVLSQHGKRHIGSDRHHGNGVHVSRCDTGHQVRCPRTAGSHTHAYLSGSSGITVRRMGCSLFMRCQYMPDFITVFVQGVIYVENGASGIAEDRVHSLLF